MHGHITELNTIRDVPIPPYVSADFGMKVETLFKCLKHRYLYGSHRDISAIFR